MRGRRMVCAGLVVVFWVSVCLCAPAAADSVSTRARIDISPQSPMPGHAYTVTATFTNTGDRAPVEWISFSLDVYPTGVTPIHEPGARIPYKYWMADGLFVEASAQSCPITLLINTTEYPGAFPPGGTFVLSAELTAPDAGSYGARAWAETPTDLLTGGRALETYNVGHPHWGSLDPFQPTPGPYQTARPDGIAQVTGVQEWANVRSGPVKSADIVGRAYLYEEVTILGWSQDGEWAQIDYQGSMSTGWIWGAFLTHR